MQFRFGKTASGKYVEGVCWRACWRREGEAASPRREGSHVQQLDDAAPGNTASCSLEAVDVVVISDCDGHVSHLSLLQHLPSCRARGGASCSSRPLINAGARHSPRLGALRGSTVAEHPAGSSATDGSRVPCRATNWGSEVPLTMLERLLRCAIWGRRGSCMALLPRGVMRHGVR